MTTQDPTVHCSIPLACYNCGKTIEIPAATCPDCGTFFCSDCAPDGKIPDHDCDGC